MNNIYIIYYIVRFFNNIYFAYLTMSCIVCKYKCNRIYFCGGRGSECEKTINRISQTIFPEDAEVYFNLLFGSLSFAYMDKSPRIDFV